MRIGKTIISLTLAQEYGAKRVLFVTTVNNVKNVIGDEKTGLIGDFTKMGCPFHLVVSTFESLHTVIEEFDFIIIDEAHRLGTYMQPDGTVGPNLATKRLSYICRELPIILQSGTPSPETESQLYHQFSVSSYSPFNRYESFSHWANVYVDIKVEEIKRFDKKTFKKYVIKRNNYHTTFKDKIFRDSEHLFVRMSMEDYGFKQKIIDRVLFCNKSNEILRIEAILKTEKKFSLDGLEIDVTKTAVLKQKILQLHSGTMIFTDPKEIDPKTHKAKRKFRILDTTKAEFIKKEFTGKKIAIFYLYKGEFELLKKIFPNWTTDQTEFNNNTHLTYLGQVRRSREGVNLSTADSIIMYNISYSALNYWQARARLMVEDREDEAIVYWVFTHGGVESGVYGRVSEKKPYTTQYFKKDWLRSPPNQLTLF